MAWPWQKPPVNGHGHLTNGHQPPAPEPAPLPKAEPPQPSAPEPEAPKSAPLVKMHTSTGKEVLLPATAPVKKLNPTAQRRVCELLGQFRTNAEVRDIIKEEFKTEVTLEAIAFYQKGAKWKPWIQEARTQFIAGLNSIPIAQKAVRLNRYEALYQRAIAKSKDHDARQALLGAQREMEGLSGETNIYVHQNILNMDTQQLEARRKEIAQRLMALNVGGADGPVEA